MRILYLASFLIIKSSADFTVTSKEVKTLMHENIPFLSVFCADEGDACFEVAEKIDDTVKQIGGQDILVNVINCHAEIDFCKSHMENEGTSVLFFYDGSWQDVSYLMEMQDSELKDFFTEEIGPKYTLIKDLETLEEIYKYEFVVVGFFSSKDDPFAKEFIELTYKLERVNFAASFSPEIAFQKNLALSSIRILHNGEEIIFNGDSIDQLESLISVELCGLLEDMTSENQDNYVGTKLPLGIFFHSNKESRDSIRENFHELAKSLKGQIQFGLFDFSTFPGSGIYFGIDEQKTPAFGLDFHEEGSKFVFSQDEEVTPENIKMFLQRVKEGQVEKYFLSEPIPEDDMDIVKKVVGNSFDEFVSRTDTNSIVLFYDPECAYTSDFYPQYEKLAYYFAHNDSVVVGKIDCINNDIPLNGFKLEYLPSIILFKPDKSVVAYKGDQHELGHFLEFLKNNDVLEKDHDQIDEENSSSIHEEF